MYQNRPFSVKQQVTCIIRGEWLMGVIFLIYQDKMVNAKKHPDSLFQIWPWMKSE